MGIWTYFTFIMVGIGTVVIILIFLVDPSTPTTPDTFVNGNEKQVVTPIDPTEPFVESNTPADTKQGPVPPELIFHETPNEVESSEGFNQDELPSVSVPGTWAEASNTPVLQPAPEVRDIPTTVKIEWPPLEQSVIDAAIREDVSPALLVGLHRPIPPGYHGNLLEDVRWTEVGQRKMARIQLSAEDATSVRVKFLVSLPVGSSLTFLGTHNEDVGHSPPVWSQTMLASRNAASRPIWGPSGERGELGIVVEVPTDATLINHFLVFEKISHRWASEPQ